MKNQSADAASGVAATDSSPRSGSFWRGRDPFTGLTGFLCASRLL